MPRRIFVAGMVERGAGIVGRHASDPSGALRLPWRALRRPAVPDRGQHQHVEQEPVERVP
jgi:hypothetical protein